MLQINVPAQEYYDERNEMFINIPAVTLKLEHSLFAISKWEAKWKKAFLGKQEKTQEETRDYIRCMTLNEEPVDAMTYTAIPAADLKRVKDYLEDKMSASCLPERDHDEGGDTVTSELIYYWLVALQIPFECQYWHLNRLLTLVQICNMKNNPDKRKMSRSELLSRNRALNAQRRAQYNSRG